MKVYSWAKHQSELLGQEVKEEKGIRIHGVKALIVKEDRSYHFKAETFWNAKKIAKRVRENNNITKEF